MEDPRKLVSEDESNVLARPMTKEPVDIAKVGEQYVELYNFLRGKKYDFQEKFDKTLIYLSSGAIVLTYSLLGSENTAVAKGSLIVAIVLWGMTCILSLISSLLRIYHTTQDLNGAGACAVNSRMFLFWTKNIKELKKVETLIEHKFLYFEKKSDGTESENEDSFKKAITSISEELENEKTRLQESLDKIATCHVPEWGWNLALLFFFVMGCIAFGVFTYFRYWA